MEPVSCFRFIFRVRTAMALPETAEVRLALVRLSVATMLCNMQHGVEIGCLEPLEGGGTIPGVSPRAVQHLETHGAAPCPTPPARLEPLAARGTSGSLGVEVGSTAAARTRARLEFKLCPGCRLRTRIALANQHFSESISALLRLPNRRATVNRNLLPRLTHQISARLCVESSPSRDNRRAPPGGGGVFQKSE